MPYNGWTAGQRVTAGGLLGMVGVWTDYACAWTAVTTPPALLNGTLVSRYQMVGQTCHLSIVLTTGSTTTYGSGAYMFSLPFTSSASSVRTAGGQGLTGAVRTDLSLIITTSGTTLQAFAPSSATSTAIAVVGSGGISGTAWASGGFLRMTIEYEIA